MRMPTMRQGGLEEISYQGENNRIWNFDERLF